MRDNTSQDEVFLQMEREIHAFYRRERLTDAAWTVAIVLCLAGVLVMVTVVR